VSIVEVRNIDEEGSQELISLIFSEPKDHPDHQEKRERTDNGSHQARRNIFRLPTMMSFADLTFNL